MKNIKALLISILISSIIAVFMHFKVLPQGGKFSPRFQSFNDLSGLLWFIIIFTVIFYSLHLYSKREDRNKVSLICPKCENVEISPRDETLNKNCSKCGTDMVLLKGFYDKKANSNHKD